MMPQTVPEQTNKRSCRADGSEKDHPPLEPIHFALNGHCDGAIDPFADRGAADVGSRDAD